MKQDDFMVLYRGLRLVAIEQLLGEYIQKGKVRIAQRLLQLKSKEEEKLGLNRVLEAQRGPENALHKDFPLGEVKEHKNGGLD